MKEWGTDLLADPDLFVNMTLVRLPEGLVGQGAPEVSDTDANGLPLYSYSHAGFVGNILHHQYRIEVKSSLVKIVFGVVVFPLLIFIVYLFIFSRLLDPSEGSVWQTVREGGSPCLQ